MDDIELPELEGKVIAAAKISHVSIHEQELFFEFTDGTSFSYCSSSKVKSETSLFRGGVGEPEIIRSVTVE